MVDSVKSLISGRVLAKSAIWNFIGLFAPILVGIAAIPYLIDGMGKERFGLLALIWMGIGYFSLFDMGLGRSLTKIVSEKLGKGEEDLGSLIWTALFLIGCLGVVGAAIAFSGSSFIVHNVLKVDEYLVEEAIKAFQVLAFGLPFVISTSALIGILQAHQKFSTIALIRMPMGLLTYLGPLLTIQFSPDIVLATSVILCARLIAFVIYFNATLQVRSELATPRRPEKSYIRPLLGYGSWLTISSIIGPILTYFDRFFVGSILSLTAVTYYVTPYEVLSRVQVLPQSILAVLFPAFATSLVATKERMTVLFGNAARILMLLMLPTTSLFFLIVPEALSLWLGEDFAQASTSVVQLLSFGWLINILAQPAATVLRSSGFAKSVALAHVGELVPFILLLWVLTSNYGITGTAIAWVARVSVDMIILNELTRYHLPDLSRYVFRSYRWAVMFAVGFFALSLIEDLMLRMIVLVLIGGFSAYLIWPTIKSFLVAPRSGKINSEV